MNEQAIKQLLEGIVRKVVGELHEQNRPADSEQGLNTTESIPVELSARHVHLSENDAMLLFGAPLTAARELSQPGQFLSRERVRVIGPKGVMDNVAVLGPSRGVSQVEISQTDARTLGVQAPVRQSGDVAGSAGIILTAGNNLVGLEEGVIVAARHIHMTPDDAVRLGVCDGDRVCVRLDTERPVILEDVLIRVHASFRLAMHIDPDEGNSAGWKSGTTGKIVGRSGNGHGRDCR